MRWRHEDFIFAKPRVEALAIASAVRVTPVTHNSPKEIIGKPMRLWKK